MSGGFAATLWISNRGVFATKSQSQTESTAFLYYGVPRSGYRRRGHYQIPSINTITSGCFEFASSLRAGLPVKCI